MPIQPLDSISSRRALRKAGGSLALVFLGAAGALLISSPRPFAVAAPTPRARPVAEASGGSAAAGAAVAPSLDAAPACRLCIGPRLAWVEESSAAARRVYARFGKGRTPIPEIYKAMSLRPDLMERVADLTDRAHFSDGFLDRRTKELIATYVSSLNACGYCRESHRENLQALGTSARQTRAVARQALDQAGLAPRSAVSSSFVKTLTLSPAKVTDADIRALRDAGWRDEQIFEAAFETSLFAFFNRMAETYGLDAPVEALASARDDIGQAGSDEPAR